MSFVINLSLETGVVPSEWKVAKVIPLYKYGYLADIENYRPISFPYFLKGHRKNSLQAVDGSSGAL